MKYLTYLVVLLAGTGIGYAIRNGVSGTSEAASKADLHITPIQRVETRAAIKVDSPARPAAPAPAATPAATRSVAVPLSTRPRVVEPETPSPPPALVPVEQPAVEESDAVGPDGVPISRVRPRG